MVLVFCDGAVATSWHLRDSAPPGDGKHTAKATMLIDCNEFRATLTNSGGPNNLRPFCRIDDLEFET